MSSEDTLIGNDLVFQIGDDNSPPNFTDMCAVFDFGEIGEEKTLVDVTALCDDARVYRGGLADGVEIPLQSNFIPGDASLIALKAAYDNDEVPYFRVARKNASPDEYFQFKAAVRAWKFSGPLGEKSVFTYTLKISGGVTWVHS